MRGFTAGAPLAYPICEVGMICVTAVVPQAHFLELVELSEFSKWMIELINE